jgi:hypothetical protein
VSINDAADAEKLNWLIINILVKIKQVKMDIIVSVRNAATTRSKVTNNLV